MGADQAARTWGIFLVQHYANIAHGAMRLQYQRLIRASPPVLADGFLFALALADLAKAARVAARRTASPAIKSAVSDFEKAIPGAKDCRDLLEHWDAYAEGKGKAQKRLALPKGRIWFWWKSTSPLILRIGGSADGLDLDITEAKDAGAKLYELIERTLSRPLGKPPQQA